MADITISVPDNQVARVRDALTALYRLEQADPPREANASDFKDFVAEQLKHIVRRHERNLAEQAARDAITDIDVT